MQKNKLIWIGLLSILLFGCGQKDPSPSVSTQSTPPSTHSTLDSSTSSSTPSSTSSSTPLSTNSSSPISSSDRPSSLTSSLSSTSTSIVDSSSSDSSSVLPTSEKDLILYHLNDVVNANSYTVKMKSSTNVRSDEIFTDQYLLSGSTSSGYVLLDDIDVKGQKMVYKYDLVNDEVEIKHAEVRTINNQRQAIRSMDVLNPMKVYKNKNVDFESLLIRDTEGFRTEDFDLICSLAELLGYESYAQAGNFPAARIYLDSEKRLSFTLQITEDYVSLVDFASGTFTDVNQAKDDRIASFITAPTFYDPMGDEMLTPLMSDEISLLSNIFSNYLDDGETSTIGYSEVDVSNQCLSIKFVDESTNNSIETFLVPDKNHFASKVHLNAKNELEYEPSKTKWEEIVKPKDLLKAGSFYKIKEDTYRYYGIYAQEIFQSMVHLSIGNIESFDVAIKNNQLFSIAFTFENTKDMMGFDFYYSVETSLLPYRNPIAPDVMEADEDTPIISESLSHINSENSYTVKTYDARESDIYTITQVTNQAIIQTKTYPRPGEVGVYDTLTTGYVLAKNGEIIPVSVDKNGILKAADEPILNTTLDELFGIQVSPNLFYNKANESYFGLKTDVYKLHEHMFGGNNLKNYDYDSLVMLYDENHYITTIKYGYTINDQITGNEIVEISQYGTTQIDESILSQIDSLTQYEIPTTWEDEEIVYNQLVQYFIEQFSKVLGEELDVELGKKIASSIPYLYDETLATKWNAFYTSKALYIDINSMGLNEDPTNYMQRYKELLKSTPGFVEDVDADGNVIYVYEDTISIFVDTSPCRGIIIKFVE